MESLRLTTRVHHCARSVKVARIITDLAGSVRMETVHLAEAIQYRPRRKN